MAYSQYFLVLLVSNSIVSLIAQEYTSIPRSGTVLNIALRHSYVLRCQYNGVGDGEFLDWFKKNDTHDVSVNTDKPGHYVVKQNEHESNLTIKIFVTADSNVTRWYVKTSRSPAACEFGRISVTPSPQGMLDNKDEILDSPHESIRRTEDESLNLKCLIEPTNTLEDSRVEWEFSTDDKEYNPLPYGIKKENAEMQIDSVQKSNRGYYRCKLNGVQFTVLLRVKDRLAALWPFLGIIATVLVLVIIIIIFERRQKNNKKNVSTDEDDHDRASDPLVRTTVKTPDNDSKKRAVKA